MGRSKESLAYLDTHIVVWLYAGLVGKLSDTTTKKGKEYFFIQFRHTQFNLR
jgi:hypothetical protein